MCPALLICHVPCLELCVVLETWHVPMRDSHTLQTGPVLMCLCHQFSHSATISRDLLACTHAGF